MLTDFRPRALFILDEAHHAAPASGSRYAVDSQFTRAVRGLAARFEHRLFLSATPHNGHSNSSPACSKSSIRSASPVAFRFGRANSMPSWSAA
jgi:hypothetical protein